jgi:hypothetical protein
MYYLTPNADRSGDWMLTNLTVEGSSCVLCMFSCWTTVLCCSGRRLYCNDFIKHDHHCDISRYACPAY